MSPNARIVQSDAVRRRQAEREAMFNALPFAPRPWINLHALGWMLTVVAILAGLLGLFVVGAA